MSRAVVVALALVVLAVSGVFMYEESLQDAGENVTVSGESWTPSAGSVTELDESNRTGAYYHHKVDVRDTNGATMEEGTDYEWIVENGTVKTLQGGALDGENNAIIDYGYHQTTKVQRDFAALASYVPMLIGLLIPAFALIIVFAFLK